MIWAGSVENDPELTKAGSKSRGGTAFCRVYHVLCFGWQRGSRLEAPSSIQNSSGQPRTYGLRRGKLTSRPPRKGSVVLLAMMLVALHAPRPRGRPPCPA